MEDYEKYLHFIFRFLSYRQRSEKEVRDKLKERKAAPEIIEQIVLFLKEQKFIDDGEFARSWIRSRKNFRIKSKKAIKMELLKKGIDTEIVEGALQGDDDVEGINDKEQAIKLVKKRVLRYKGLPREEIYKKLSGFLARRGFGWETIKASIDAVLKLEYNDGDWQ